MNLYYEIYKSPIGELCIITTERAIVELLLFKEEWMTYIQKHNVQATSQLGRLAISQLKEYFAGERISFELPMDLKGTPYQLKVWEALRQIPFGSTVSYQEIAKRIGSPKSVRAIGQANRANRLPIIIPCHRVIGKNGSMKGYAGAHIDLKTTLLDLEKQLSS